MSSSFFEPVTAQLRRRLQIVQMEAQRMLPSSPWPEPVELLQKSLDEQIASLLSLGEDCGSGSAVSRALWTQHEALRRHSEALASLLDALPGLDASLGWPQASARLLLADFARELGDHLAFEEEQGCLERAAEAEPRFATRIAALRDEHEAFRDGMARLVAVAEGALRAGFAWEPVGHGFRELCAALQRHEEAEAEVVYQAYSVDLGGNG